MPCGPELFALPAHIVRNHGVGGIQNSLSRPVILFQTDDPGPGVLLLKRQNVLNGSAAETVDTLVIVTHHADIAPLPGQQCRQQVLDVVGILIFVNQNILKLVLIIFSDIRLLLKKLYGDIENVVKVQGIVVFQPLLIGFVGFGNLRQPQVRGAAALFQHLLRRDELILLAADDGQHQLGREGLVIQAHIF